MPEFPAALLYNILMVELDPSVRLLVNASLRVFPSLESFQIAVRTVRPSFLRTIFQVSGCSIVTDNIVPESPGWSVPSAATISDSPAPLKMKLYLSFAESLHVLFFLNNL